MKKLGLKGYRWTGVFFYVLLLAGFLLALASGIFKYNPDMILALVAFMLINIYFVNKAFHKRKYFNCPNCDKSLNVVAKWQCVHCNNFQKKDRCISLPCDECDREQTTAFCEHCHQEFEI